MVYEHASDSIFLSQFHSIQRQAWTKKKGIYFPSISYVYRHSKPIFSPFFLCSFCFDVLCILFVPLYFYMISCAVWIFLWAIFFPVHTAHGNKSKNGLTKRMQNDIWAKLMSKISAKSIHIRRFSSFFFFLVLCWPVFLPNF